MSFKIIPIVKLKEDIWSLPDRQLLVIYLKLLKHRLVDKVFIMGEISTPDKFIAMIKNPRNVFNVVINEENEYMGLMWLNRWGFNHAFVHHCFFPEAWGKHTVEIGKMVLKYWFGMKKDNGEPILDVLMGKTPENNRLAVRFIKKMGFTIIGTVPTIYFDAKLKKKIGAIFSYIRREEAL